MLAQDFKEKLQQWKEFSAQEDLYQIGFAQDSALRKIEAAGGFNKLLIIKLLRPEKIMQSSSHYVSD